MASTRSQTATPKRASKMNANQSLNLNHLLNFSLPPRQSQPPPRRSRKVHQAVWNKERFVNAQYRFVMNPAGDYTVHFADPDIFFQWNDILQVIISRSSTLASAMGTSEAAEGHTTCPVCLSPPTAPRMTKCGHIFCFPCILHYLSLSENKWARCPICFDSVNDKQLKCVKWFDTDSVTFPDEHHEDVLVDTASSSSATLDNMVSTTPREGSLLRMRLMQRPQITTLALPRSATWPSDLLPPHQAPFHFLPDVYSHSKFMLATPTYIISDLSRDLDELATERRILAGMGDELGIVYIDAAEQKVRNQLIKASALDTLPLRNSIEKAHRDQQEIEDRVAYHAQRKKEEEASRSVNAETPEVPLTMAPPPTTSEAPSGNRNSQRQRRNINPPPPSTSTYYYYQAASGLPVFLHPLDIRILVSHYTSYASFPDTITVRVSSMAEGTVNDDLRKRCKYLAHMPEGADVVFVEADLEDVVGQNTLKNFEGALKMRKNRRKEKERKDDRAKLRAEERERDRIISEATTWNTTGSRGIPGVPLLRSEDAEEVVESAPVIPQQTSGAWGQRSFASTLHAPSTAPRRSMHPPVEDDEDWDAAWHDLEQRSSGGRRKRSNKMLVLGGGGGRRR